MKPMKVIFVTRKFPPSVGGLETAAQGLYASLCQNHDVKLIKWGGGNGALPIIYPWLFIRTIIDGLIDKPDIIYLQDGVLAPLGLMAKLLLRRPAVISVHGLDVRYPSRLYKFLMNLSLPRLDRVIAGSQWTRQQALKRYPNLNIDIISYGFNDVFAQDRNVVLKQLKQDTSLDLPNLINRQVLLTTGRLVPRKGVEWFVQNVLPAVVKQLPNTLYIVVGEGPKKADIQRAVDAKKLHANVLLLGQINDQKRNMLYNLADLFLMPNIPMDNDGEGFGLVALEAASCGTPVIGAELEGIKDAIKPGKSGYLVSPEDAEAWAKLIIQELQKPSLARADVRQYVVVNRSWQRVATEYAKVFKSVC
jgi:glycosyltransferase involved in cell wall biosynthesis